ncbi:helix-turn-helix transcriptional regulator [Mycolicibacterium fallax]|uniref:Uncharacterized protein n=1 Tax=Mycolicibacterium fallax TaxID=1793 RepID=A0A1X1RCY2_MYCFA|nr:helix-turn-helix transcriptional regulator [Mycolicibacterium fallax]ORV03091.1 hypothetical protein AWC04_10650 [Mycolicibacterium fallax]BBY98916.1 hypothetical protein MFAL_23830 [Mycolicibacterium fallax]HOW93112.1 helix-turn-helix transcriptional regulator [Mycolicibacterium fallax]
MRGIGNDLVREARKRAGLTQRELAALAGTTQSALARVESGRTAPSFDQVLRLIRLCGLDLDIMLVERDDSDYAQASRLAELTAEQRWTRATQVADQMRQFRNARSRSA